MQQHRQRGVLYPELDTLPRGPHRLDPDDVASSQIGRLRAAVVALVADGGYEAVTITAIAKRARVSPNAFYQHYPNKQACYLDAYMAFNAVVLDELAQASGNTIEALILAMLTQYFGLLDREPKAARAFMIEIDGSGALGREHRRAAYHLAATTIEQRYLDLRGDDPTQPVINERVFLAILTAVHGLATEALETGAPQSLAELIDECSTWITALFRGFRRP